MHVTSRAESVAGIVLGWRDAPWWRVMQVLGADSRERLSAGTRWRIRRSVLRRVSLGVTGRIGRHCRGAWRDAVARWLVWREGSSASWGRVSCTPHPRRRGSLKAMGPCASSGGPLGARGGSGSHTGQRLPCRPLSAEARHSLASRCFFRKAPPDARDQAMPLSTGFVVARTS